MLRNTILITHVRTHNGVFEIFSLTHQSTPDCAHGQGFFVRGIVVTLFMYVLFYL